MDSDIELTKAAAKFELTGTSNNSYRHRYSCIKKEEFKKTFIAFMVALGFKEEKIKRSFIGYIEDYDEDGIAYEKPFQIKISDLLDVCDNYQNETYDIDVFYGDKEIIILVRVKSREGLIKEIVDKSTWKKFPKISYKNKKLDVSKKQKKIAVLVKRSLIKWIL